MSSNFGQICTINKKQLRIWNNIKQRCTNPKATSYKYYGGRGIGFLLTLADINFLWDRDNAYNLKKPSLDRIDNNGHYVLFNCRFIELKENISKRNKEKFNDRTVLNNLISDYQI